MWAQPDHLRRWGAFSGPVVTPRPQGEAALELWDAYRSIITFDGFFELKRQITGNIVF